MYNLNFFSATSCSDFTDGKRISVNATGIQPIGTIVQYVCESGYVTELGKPWGYAVCSSGGLWTNINNEVVVKLNCIGKTYVM